MASKNHSLPERAKMLPKESKEKLKKEIEERTICRGKKMENAHPYEKFFQSAEWLEYERKNKLKQKIKEMQKVQILTTQSSEYISYLPRGAKVTMAGINLDFEIEDFATGEWIAQKLQKEALISSEIGLLFAAIDEMQNSRSASCEVEVYISLIRPQLPISFSRYCTLQPTDDLFLGFLGEKIMRKIIEQTILSNPEKFFEVELTLQRKITYETLHNIKLEKPMMWHYKKEPLGKLAKTSEGYLLDGVNVGSKTAVEGKIKYCMDMLDREAPSGRQLPEVKGVFIGELVEKEKSAAILMRDMIGCAALERLLREGCLRVKSKDGKEYKINLKGEVFSLPEEDYICLEVEGDLPVFDEILAKYLFLREAPPEEIGKEIETARHFQEEEDFQEADSQNIDYLEEHKGRRNASYDVSLDGRITAISLEEQGEKVN